MKKAVLVFAGVLFALFAMAQSPDFTEKDIFYGQAPLTNADIDKLIKNTTFYAKLLDDMSANNGLIKAENLRDTYVLSKVSLAHQIMYASDVDQKDFWEFVPKSLRPTDAEMALIAKRKEDIRRAMEKIDQELSE